MANPQYRRPSRTASAAGAGAGIFVAALAQLLPASLHGLQQALCLGAPGLTAIVTIISVRISNIVLDRVRRNELNRQLTVADQRVNQAMLSSNLSDEDKAELRESHGALEKMQAQFAIDDAARALVRLRSPPDEATPARPAALPRRQKRAPNDDEANA